jgi:hypothetical protein
LWRPPCTTGGIEGVFEMTSFIGRATEAEFSTSKVRCVGCRNLIGLEQARVLDEGWVCCARCFETARHQVKATLTTGVVEIVG